MTLLNHAYATEIHDRIRSATIPLVHLSPHADPDVISARIETGVEYPGDEGRSEKVRIFRRGRVSVYADAYARWLRTEAGLVDTTRLDRAKVMGRALEIIGER
ncbi:hypothetical protein ACFV1W_33450 [Kitasatospora sp. NPDC059648]|uniref:hypothetical protein n=1 Tax=Kitasatospora sp. NPDC059648 TaxID=3346894 RepID=UPI0036C6383D